LPYHIFVAVQRKNARKGQNKTSRGSQVAVVFWLVFIVVIICLFMANAQTIQKNFNIFKTRLTTSPGSEELIFEEEEKPEETAAPVQPERPAGQTTQETAPQRQPDTTQTETRPQAVERPAQQPAQQQRPQPETPPPPQPVQTRDRNIYFTQINKDGQILHSRVTRKIPVSETPMQDSLNAMLMGLSAEELNKGLINMIPANTRIISTIVRGSTAYINFSEDFQFNTFGIEG
jgi:spore germination protein GerM